MNYFYQLIRGVKKTLSPKDDKDNKVKWEEPCMQCQSARAIFPHKYMVEAVAWVGTGGELKQCQRCGWWRDVSVRGVTKEMRREISGVGRSQ